MTDLELAQDPKTETPDHSEGKRICNLATAQAKTTLKRGDRLRVTKCPGTKRWITFERWDGDWIVSKSGINDYHAINIDMVNDRAINFPTEFLLKPNNDNNPVPPVLQAPQPNLQPPGQPCSN
jgi:hypothetical protein